MEGVETVPEGHVITHDIGCEAEIRPQLLVVNKLGSKVQFYHSEDFSLLAELDMPNFPHEVVISPDRTCAYISIYGKGIFGKNTDHPGHELIVIDLKTRSIVSTIDVAPYLAPHGMMFDRLGTLWVSCDLSGALLAMTPSEDFKTAEIEKVVPTSSQGTHWLVVQRRGDKLYASNKHFPFLVVVDVIIKERLTDIPMPEGSEGLALSPDDQRLYVMAQSPHAIHVFDTNTDTVLSVALLSGIPPTPPGKNPQKRIQIAPDGSVALISSFTTAQIIIAPLNSLDSQTVLSVPAGPMGITFDREKAHRAFSMNHDHGSISLLDLHHGLILDTFMTAPGPETMALV
jgi:DNA-binding beta-propeller fold protein YncE